MDVYWILDAEPKFCLFYKVCRDGLDGKTLSPVGNGSHLNALTNSSFAVLFLTFPKCSKSSPIINI